MRKITIILLAALSMLELNLAQKNSKEESNEEKDTEWIDNPEIELPESVIVCPRYSSDRDECIKKSIQALLPTFKDGYSKLGIAPFDPLLVKRAYFEYKQNQLLTTLNIKNAKVFGMSGAEVQDVRSNLTETTFDLDIDVRFPKVLMEGNYKGDGRFNEYKVKSKGFFNVSYNNVFIMWSMSAVLETRNDENYMKVQSVNIVPAVGHMKVFATGIFPDPILNQLALDFINEYWPYYYQQMLPETRKSWEPILVNAVNQIFNRVPFRRLMSTDVRSNTA